MHCLHVLSRGGNVWSAVEKHLQHSAHNYPTCRRRESNLERSGGKASGVLTEPNRQQLAVVKLHC